MNELDLVVIVLYFCVLIGIGVFAGSRIKNSEDYMVAGRSLGFPVLMGTLVGTVIGAAATFGKAGKAYEVGYAVFISVIAYMLGYIALCFLAPKLQQAKLDTVPSALEKRYGKSMRIVAAGILSLAVIALFGAQLIAIGLTAESVFGEYGVTFEQAVIVATLIIVIYTVVGGLMAVAYNDLFQTTVMIIGGGILLPLFLYLDLGDSFTVAMIDPATEFLGGMHWGYVLSFFPIYFSFALIDPTIWQRIGAAKSNDIVKPALIGTTAIYCVWAIIVITLGVIASNIMPGLEHGDGVIPALVMEHMPPMMKGLCLAAIMGIIISTADSALLITGTTVSTDVFKVLKPEISDKAVLRINRLTILIVAAFGLVFALQRSGIFDIMLLALAIFVAGLFVPVMSALFLPISTKPAAISAAIVGASAEIIAFVAKSKGLLPEWSEPIVIALTASAITMLLVSKFTHNESNHTAPLLKRAA